MTIPGSANPLLLKAPAGGGGGGYAIERSVRFNSNDSAYLSRVGVSSPTNNKICTFAFWVKRCLLNSGQVLIGGRSTADFHYLGFSSTFSAYDGLEFRNGSTGAFKVSTLDLLRDPSAWYHIVLSIDTTQATPANRVRIYINGTEAAYNSVTYPSQNTVIALNAASYTGEIGVYLASQNALSAYLADVHFIDGQALDPTSFGEFDANGIWQPIAYSGSYGTNGFHLPFSDNSSDAALGTDTSGNSNTWTVNNISVAAGAGNDSLVDSPTNGTASSGGDAGGGVVGNYCTWNPLINGDTAANGNLDVTNDTARGTHKLLDYDAYWEITSTGGTTTAGVVSDGGTTNTTTVADTKTYGFKLSAAGSLDYINITDGGSFTNITTGLTGIQFPYASAASATTGSLNAGQRAFAAAAPAGFKGICTANLPTPTIEKGSDYFDTTLYTGNGSTQTISGLGFSPDLVWIKGRSGATDHALYDTVRGVQQQLESNTTTDETTESTGLTAFNSDGFALGALAQANTSSATYAAWCWDENVSAGFDIVTYTGNGSARTIAHSLGVAPSMIIVKARTTASTDQGWAVYHAANTAAPATDYLLLNSTAATADLDTVWNDTAPTSSVFSVGTNALVNANNDTYVAYCFAPVDGYSSFGSYIGNGSTDGPFVFCGFRPRYVLQKKTSDVSAWSIRDAARDPYNAANTRLWTNFSSAESSADAIDILSNGFKVRNTDTDWNASSATYIYAAFAENPFSIARAR